jgi:hypothetical protein
MKRNGNMHCEIDVDEAGLQSKVFAEKEKCVSARERIVQHGFSCIPKGGVEQRWQPHSIYFGCLTKQSDTTLSSSSSSS